MVLKKTLNIKEHTEFNPTVITMDYKFNKTLLGTVGGDIFVNENDVFTKVH